MTDLEQDEIRELAERFEAFRLAVYRSLAIGAFGLVLTAVAAGIYVGGKMGDVDYNSDAVRAIGPLRERVAIVESGVPRLEDRLERIEARLDIVLGELRRDRIRASVPAQ